MTRRPSASEGPGSGRGAQAPGSDRVPGRLPVAALCWWEVADALWLAEHHPGLAEPTVTSVRPSDPDASPDGKEAEPTRVDDAPEDTAAPHGATRPTSTDAPTDAPDPGTPDPDGADPGGAGPGGASEDEPGGRAGPADPSPGGWTSRAPNALVGVVSTGSGERGAAPHRRAFPVPPRTERGVDAAALGRALRSLRERVGSGRTLEVDEDLTAERLATSTWLPPVLRPAAEARWDAVLVVDGGPRMAVWRATARHLARVLHRYGGFRHVALRRLDSDAAAPDGVQLRGASPGAPAQPWRSLVDPHGRRMVLVLTDGLSQGWRTGAVLSLLRDWGRHQPLALLHALPQRLWHRTGLFPERVRLHASGPRSGNGQVEWEFAEPPLPWASLGEAERRRLVPVPVLEVAGSWLAPWARFVAGNGPRWTEVAAVLAGPWQGPGADDAEPAAARPMSPAERVARFRVWASPQAFDLATRLAAVQLDLPIMSVVQRHTLPASGPAHLAEFLMSGLVDAWSFGGEGSFLFHRGVREELLAAGTRRATEKALRKAAEFMAPRNQAAQELLFHLDGVQHSRDPEVTGENLRFLLAEHAVLEALSGPHLHRARRLRGLIEAHISSTDDPIDISTQTYIPGDAVPLIGKGSGTVTYPGTPDMRNNPGPVPVPSPRGDDSPSKPGGGTTMATPAAQGVPLAHPGRDIAVRPAVMGNMPPRNMVFTGREELLDQLESGLREGPTAVLPHALHGMGGVGKSQLALEYVYRHATEYDIVWWIPAERPTQIAQALVELAQRLRLPVTGEALTAVPAVLEALRTGNPYGRWLLVFDNAESPEAVREYFPTAPGSGPIGSILVTSRNPQWNTLAHPLEVDVFEREESIHLLQRRNPDLPTEEANQLAEILGDLPLAVEQASAWRAETGMPAAEYLRLFEEKRAELMTVSPPTHYEETVATAWNVSLDHLERKNAAALQLLQVCAYFAPEPISRTLFSGAAVEPIAPDLDRALTDPLRLGRAIREINRYSLAKIDHRTNSIEMHRLVQAVLIARMSEEQRARMRRGAHLLLAASTPRDPQDPEHWPRFKELYPHVVVSEAMRSESPVVRQAVYSVAEYLYYWGEHESAREFAQRAYDIWRDAFGEADRQGLMMGRQLRFVLWGMGRYSQAAAVGEAMLDVLQREAVSDTDEELLRVMGQVAVDRRAQGDYRAALALDQEVYDRALRAFGEDDPETLLHAHNLGVCLRVNGEFRRALELDQLTWQRKAQMYGEESLSGLLTETSVALDRRNLGEYAMAAQLFEGIVDKYRRAVGEENLATLRATARLGVSLRKAGYHDRASELTEAVRRALTKRYGHRHPDALVASLNASVDLRQLGDLNEALHLGQRTRDLYAEVFGPDHPNTLSADMDLAVTYRLLNRVDAARRLNESVLDRCVERLGEHHPDALVCRTNLASDMFAQGEVAAAAELDRWTLEASITVLNEEHPSVLALKSNLAQDLKALGHTEEAQALHEQAVEGIRRHLGEHHPALADAIAWRRSNCDADPLPL